MAVYFTTQLVDTYKNNRLSAEFFRPEYRFIPKDEKSWAKIGSCLKKCQYGISILMNEIGKGYPIFRMNELENCFATKAVKYANINEKEFHQFKVNENDILFNRTNSIDFVGRTGIVKENTNSVFASYLIRAIPDINIIRPEFIAIYLNTKFGIGQIRRRAMPSINQANVSAAELRQILIPLFPLAIQDAVSDLVNKSFKLKQHSQSLYTQAQELLEGELGLDKLQFDKPLSYEARLSDVVGKLRGDAEFHNPMLKEYYGYLSRKHDLVKITEYAKVIKFGNPTYSGKGIPIITQKHLQDITPAGYGNDLLADDAWVHKYPSAILKINDLLFYSVGAYLGKTNIWLNKDKAVHASFITMLRCPVEFDSGYLMVLLNSKYGLLQSKVFQSGTSQQYIYPKDIRKFLVPKVAKQLRVELYNLITNSQKVKIESQILLEQAKRRVEELIEEAVKK